MCRVCSNPPTCFPSQSMALVQFPMERWANLHSHLLMRVPEAVWLRAATLKHSSVKFSCSVMSDSLRPHELQHTRPPWSSLKLMSIESVMPSNHLILCYPLLLPSVFPSNSFQMSQFSESGGQSIGVSASASVLSMNIQDWFPLGRTGWISLQCKGLSKVSFNTTVQKHQFLGAQLSL